MSKSKMTKRALLTSVTALVLCFAMLTGTTFAWFTDTETSAANKIVAGNLDVELYHSNKNVEEELITAETTNLFKIDKWEPGAVAYENFTVKNAGNLAFNYMLNLIVNGFNTIDGASLSDALKVIVLDDEHFSGERDAAVALFADTANKVMALSDVAASGTLYVEDDDETAEVEANEKKFAVIVYWQEGDDNVYNVNDGKTTSDGQPLYIDIAVSLLATQLAYENDAFDNTYDEGAMSTPETANELKAAIEAGGVIVPNLNAGEDASSLSVTVTKDATVVLSGTKIGGSFTIAEGATLTLQNGSAAPITVSGDGTLVLDGVTVSAVSEAAMALLSTDSTDTASADALTVADGETANIVINGNTKVIGGKNGDAIHVGTGATLELSGKGTLTAIGNEGKEYLEGYDVYSNTDDASYAGTGGSGIGGEGAIHITNLAGLTAEGYGKHGFGIGGNTKDVTITGTNIAYVRGGYAHDKAVKDTDYAKTEPEGGAAIGSSNKDNGGAVITLENVTVAKAEGGSKSAGIGAQYWSPVTVNITNCDIKEVIGGNSSAAIGGSRVRSEGCAIQTTTVTITDSKIKAQGGYFGAGIGSGYDTHCHNPYGYATVDSKADPNSTPNLDNAAPLCTVNIKGNSVIEAKGGKYAAGIGTGYHTAMLAGVIESTVTVTAYAPDEAFYKDAYTTAMDIGFGVVDPNRDAYENDSYITYNGQNITIPAVGTQG